MPGTTQRGLVPVSGQVDSINDVIAIAKADRQGPWGPQPKAPSGVRTWGSGILPSSRASSSTSYTGAHDVALQTATHTKPEERTQLLYEQQVAMALMRDRGEWLTHKANRQALIDELNKMD